MKCNYEGIIQGFNLSIGSHLVMQTLQLGGLGRGRGAASPHFKLFLPILPYITCRFETLFLLTTYSNFSVLNYKLGLQTNYPLAQMFFFTVATAYPTSCCMSIHYCWVFNSTRTKPVCSCLVWKLSNDACPLNLIPSASFLMQSNW